MEGDNWEHKAKNMLCETCMYYCNFRCRRHSPALSGWVSVFADDWCGDHKLDKYMMSVLQDRRENGKDKKCKA
mgnify:CR=1 FL=1